MIILMDGDNGFRKHKIDKFFNIEGEKRVAKINGLSLSLPCD